MLWKRIASGLIGIPVLLVISYLGGNCFRIGVGIIILLGLYEYYSMMGNRGDHPPLFFGFFSGFLILTTFFQPEYTYLMVFLVLLIHALVIVFGRASFEDIVFSLFGIFFIVWTLGHLILIRETFLRGFNYIFLCFVITWITDTGAYFSGRFLGKHKLSPRISPNKTVEGAVGGTILCVVAVFVLQGLFSDIPLGLLLILSVLGSLVGQVGDLVESAVKRWAGVKDSGKIIPGHGGLLDRFDSLTLVAPLVYYFINALI